MNSFSINSCTNIGIAYLDEMVETVEKQLPILKEAWENLAPYTFNNRWRPLLDVDLETIGTGHYTLLKSLNYIRKNKDSVRMNDPEQRFKNIYFHFGLIIDCIKQISRSIILFKTKLGLINFQELKYSIEDIVQITNNWYKNNYETSYNKLVNNGVAIALQLQPAKEYIYMLGTKKELNLFSVFKNSIQPYRNVFIHNPAIDIFIVKGKKGQFVVKKDVIKNCRFLNQLDKTKPSNLTNPVEMVNQDYSDCLQVISTTWYVLLKHIKEINNHPDFKRKRDRN